jgi:hypothetical protein
VFKPCCFFVSHSIQKLGVSFCLLLCTALVKIRIRAYEKSLKYMLMDFATYRDAVGATRTSLARARLARGAYLSSLVSGLVFFPFKPILGYLQSVW